MKVRKDVLFTGLILLQLIGIAWRGIWHGACSYGCHEEKA